MIKKENNQLLSDLKNYLDITFEDNAINEKLDGILLRGKSYLCSFAGNKTLDFAIENESRQLLFDYCMYAYNGALNDFENNYKGGLINLRIQYQVGGLHEKKI